MAPHLPSGPLLLAHFNRIAEAPDAIPRLRQFILDLAVRGKLVPQDPNEGDPESRLLELHEERITRANRGALKAAKVPVGPFLDAPIPFLPASWRTVGLDHLAIPEDNALKAGPFGSALKKDFYVPRGYKVYGQEQVIAGDPFLGNYYINQAKFTQLQSCVVQPGDILISLVGTIGKVLILPTGIEPGIINPRLIKLTLSPLLVYPLFFKVLLGSPYAVALLRERSHGATMDVLNLSILREIPIPLPPLAEQHRIVAKVDELMALCDRLEAAQAERETRRTRLVAATHARLASSVPGTPHSQFFINSLPRLTARPEDIQHLRQTTLNLAVRGKLVPQDPNDEPAAVSLDRIKAERESLRATAKPKGQKPSASDGQVPPHQIPPTWHWARLEDITELITKGSSPRWQGIQYVSQQEGIPFITSENVGNYRLRKLEDLKYVEKRFNAIEPRSILRTGDILMNLVGASIGRTALYDLPETTANINQAVALIRPFKSPFTPRPEFLLHYLNSPVAIKLMLASQVVTAQPNISLTDARKFPIPVPPRSEQKRIVAKVDELMALCDRLQARLNATQDESRRLLESLLHQALTL